MEARTEAIELANDILTMTTARRRGPALNRLFATLIDDFPPVDVLALAEEFNLTQDDLVDELAATLLSLHDVHNGNLDDDLSDVPDQYLPIYLVREMGKHGVNVTKCKRYHEFIIKYAPILLGVLHKEPEPADGPIIEEEPEP